MIVLRPFQQAGERSRGATSTVTMIRPMIAQHTTTTTVVQDSTVQYSSGLQVHLQYSSAAVVVGLYFVRVPRLEILYCWLENLTSNKAVQLCGGVVRRNEPLVILSTVSRWYGNILRCTTARCVVQHYL